MNFSHLTDDSVKVRVGGSFNIKISSAYILYRFIIHQETTVYMIYGWMSCQYCVIRLDYSWRYLQYEARSLPCKMKISDGLFVALSSNGNPNDKNFLSNRLLPVWQVHVYNYKCSRNFYQLISRETLLNVDHPGPRRKIESCMVCLKLGDLMYTLLKLIFKSK